MDEDRLCNPGNSNNTNATVYVHRINVTFTATGVFILLWILIFNIIAISWFVKDMCKRAEFCPHRLIATAVCTMDFLFGGIEPVIIGFLAGHLVRLAIGKVDSLCFKLLQYSEVTAISASVNTVNYFVGYCKAGGDSGCQWRGFALTFTTRSSQMMVVTLTVERFIALKFPFQHHKLMSKYRSIGVIIGLLCYTVCLRICIRLGYDPCKHGLLQLSGQNYHNDIDNLFKALLR